VLASARKQTRSIREKDLKRHMTNTDTSVDSRGSVLLDDKSDSLGGDTEGAPIKLSPREDYQVQQALGYLKSFEVFERMGKKRAETTKQ
jgi:hypothetical protein